MCSPWHPSSLHCCRWGCICWKSWMRPVLLIFAAVWLMTAPGCCSTSSTRDIPALPVLPSLQRASLNGTMGLWMDSDDAGHLAAWIHDVTGENGL